MSCTCGPAARDTIGAPATGVCVFSSFPCPEHGWADFDNPEGFGLASASPTATVTLTGQGVSMYARCPACGHVGNMEAP